MSVSRTDLPEPVAALTAAARGMRVSKMFDLKMDSICERTSLSTVWRATYIVESPMIIIFGACALRTAATIRISCVNPTSANILDSIGIKVRSLNASAFSVGARSDGGVSITQ